MYTFIILHEECIGMAVDLHLSRASGDLEGRFISISALT